MHTSVSSYWEMDRDDICIVRWENKMMYCIFSVFGVHV